MQRLNEIQADVLSDYPKFHPFTCGNRGDHSHAPVNSVTDVLVATSAGWICPYCGATQDWAYLAMAEPHPRAAEFQASIDALINRNGILANEAMLSRVEGAIDAYRALSASLKLSLNQSADNAAMRAWEATEVMLECLNRRRVVLEGVEGDC